MRYWAPSTCCLRIAADRDPRAIVICFGAEAAHYRVELYPPYHADRPAVPDALAWQFEQAPELFEAFGWACESSPDLEADDLLGSLARVEEHAGGSTLIMTGDRDMYQCADDHTSVVFLKGGTADSRRSTRPRSSVATGSGPNSCRTSSRCEAIRPTACRGRPGSARRPRPSCCASTARSTRAIDGAAQERPRIRAALTELADQLRAYREIATLRTVELERPEDRPTDLDGGAQAARALRAAAACRAPRASREAERPVTDEQANQQAKPTRLRRTLR